MGNFNKLLSSEPNKDTSTCALAEIDEYCDQFELDWKSGKCPRIEDYLMNIAEDRKAFLLRELMMIELQLRQPCDLTSVVESFKDRFPDQTHLVEKFSGEQNVNIAPNLLRRLRKPKAVAAWQRFVDLFGPIIFYGARQKGLNPTEAAELLQGVLAILVGKLRQIEFDSTFRFRGWLMKITEEIAKDRHSELFSHGVTVVDSADLFDEAEYRSVLVHRALELLRSEYQDTTWQACRLQVVEGHKASDVARRLGISVNAAVLAKSCLLSRLRVELNGQMD